MERDVVVNARLDFLHLGFIEVVSSAGFLKKILAAPRRVYRPDRKPNERLTDVDVRRIRLLTEYDLDRHLHFNRQCLAERPLNA